MDRRAQRLNDCLADDQQADQYGQDAEGATKASVGDATGQVRQTLVMSKESPDDFYTLLEVDPSIDGKRLRQVWRKLDTEQNFLVTRLYHEALSTYAALRPTGAENSAIVKIKVERTPDGLARCGSVG